MTFQTFVFYFFAAVLIFAALRVITSRNPVHAALFLVLAFFTSAGIWLQLQAEFLAITLVLVYVGAGRSTGRSTGMCTMRTRSSRRTLT